MLLTSKIKTAASYIVRPSSYPFLMRLLKTRLRGGSMSLDDTPAEAEDWCRSRAVSTEQALAVLGFDCHSPESLHSGVFDASRKAVAQCPQQMGGAGNTSLLYSLVAGSGSLSVIETGVAYGWSSLSILLALDDLERQGKGTGSLRSTNLHYPKYDGDEQFVGCAVPESLKKYWKIFRENDSEAIPKILAEMPIADLVHYDSSKSYAGRGFAYPLLWEALKTGGLFVSDDIDDNVGFKHFCIRLKSEPIIIRTPQESGRDKYVGIIKKVDSRQPREIMF